ncbi:MAG: exodeoxyribonuclease VII small subunit [Clostridiales bacterium]|nr:exodeoxyribonuclease VII small subunit [Clostridiales bacterium]
MEIKTTEKIEKMNYESKINELQTILGKIESADVPLQEGMKLFEDGLTLAKDCLDTLDRAQAEIEGLKNELDIILSKHASE